MAPSFQETRRRKQTRTFFGRTEHLERFRANLALRPEDRDFIFLVHGNAGVGKSLLLNEFRTLADERGALSVRVDENHTNDVVDTLHAIITQLTEHGLKFAGFTKQHKEYVRRRHELLSDKNAPEGLSGLFSQGTAYGGAAAARLAGAGVIADQISPAKVAESADKAFTYVKGRVNEPKELRLMLDPTGELTRILTRELNEGLNGRTLALFVDTFEAAAPQVSAWLVRSLTTSDYGELPGGFVLAVAGQHRPDPNAWSELGDLKVEIELEPFTHEETKELLQRRSVTDSEVAEQIWESTRGLPVLMATLAQASPNSIEEIADHSGEAVERFLKWIKDPEQRLIAQLASLPRELDQDILTALLPDKSKPKAPELYRWLRTLPFVIDRSGKCHNHQVVRTFLVRLQRNSSPKEFTRQHALLAKHHAESGEARLPLEQTYHQLCADQGETLPAALRVAVAAAVIGESELRQWATMMYQAGQDSGAPKTQSWGNHLLRALDAITCSGPSILRRRAYSGA